MGAGPLCNLDDRGVEFRVLVGVTAADPAGDDAGLGGSASQPGENERALEPLTWKEPIEYSLLRPATRAGTDSRLSRPSKVGSEGRRVSELGGGLLDRGGGLLGFEL